MWQLYTYTKLKIKYLLQYIRFYLIFVKFYVKLGMSRRFLYEKNFNIFMFSIYLNVWKRDACGVWQWDKLIQQL